MNTIELREFLSKFQTNHVFKGVFACDMLPKKVSLPAAFIINLSPISEPGIHWVSLYIDENGSGEYFDSYGLKPTNKCILHFIKFHCKICSYNKRQLQHINSIMCGLYSASYIVHKLMKKSLQDFCKMFGKNTYINDIVIEKIFCYLNKKYL